MDKIYIEKLYVKNFRNLKETTLSLSKNINCIFGKNGNGKTSILEAIYYLSYKKSFKKKTGFTQLLNQDGENNEIIIKSLVEQDSEKKQLAIKVDENEMQYFEGTQKIKRPPQFHSIIINPFDSFLFYSKSSERRDWFDHAISNIDNEYKVALRNYSKALRMRNSLLKKYFGPKEHFKTQINAIDHQLAKNAKILIEKRIKFCSELSPKLENNFKDIFNFAHKVTLSYQSLCEGMDQAELFEFFNSKLDEDRIIKATRRGVHLDDYELKIDNYPLGEFGSIGQQKVSYLSLLFSYVGYLEETLKIAPILLIDDISGELDSVCWKNLLKYLETKKLQVLITTANDAFRDELSKLNDAHKIVVNNGEIRELLQ